MSGTWNPGTGATFGADSFVGTSGADSADGLGGSDTLLGGDGDDILVGGANNDSLVGGAGADTLSGLWDGGADSHNDSMVGGADNDIYLVEAGRDSVIEAVNQGVDTVLLVQGSTTAYTIPLFAAGVENLALLDPASTTAFTLQGNALDNQITGGAGHDRLFDSAGANTLDGGAGNDTLSSTDSNWPTVNVTGSRYLGGAGNDQIGGGFGNDTILGGDDADTVTAEAGNDWIEGGGGNDSVWGGGGSNGGADTIFGGAGADTIRSVSVASDTMGDYLSGDADNDIITGGHSADTILGGTGADTIIANRGDDSIEGGIGADSINAGNGADTVFGGDDADTIIATGDNIGDYLSGDGGNDSISTGTGADTLSGGAGDDNLDGGAGSGDVVSYADASGRVVVSLATGRATGAAGNDTLANFEIVIGSNHNDQLTGGTGNDTLVGGNGNDGLDGGAGDDLILGGEGRQEIYAGTGNDTVLAGDGETGGVGGNIVDGGSGHDSIDVGYGVVYGDEGDDTLVASGTEYAWFRGGAGNDSIVGNDAVNVADYNLAVSGVAVNLVTGFATGGDDNDTLVSIEGVFGSQFNDTLTGDTGANTLEASDGDDQVFDGGGSNYLDGGDGTDRLTFTTAGFYNIVRDDDTGELTITYLGADSSPEIDNPVSTAANFEEFTYNNGTFNLVDPTWNGTDLLYVCFAAGTRIQTATGEVAVEQLQPGDRVVTLAGRGLPVKPVLWVGRRHVVLAGRADAAEMAPIRIKAGALGPNVPQRDLLVSPDHCLYLDGALVPARLLVNGRSVVAEIGMAEVTWYHVELETHEVLVANGAAAESWLDCGNRSWFQNAPVAMLTVPGNLDAVGTGWDATRACAPLVHGGEQLGRIRAGLEARAEALTTTAPEPARMAR